MEIQITEEAVNWYKNEYEIKEGNFRFFVRYGGIGGQIPGFSLGVLMEDPYTPHASTIVNQVQFFIEESDKWYFEQKDLLISLNEEMNEPRFTYQ